jgi:hypothetical protein
LARSIRQRLFMPLGTAIALIVGIWVAVALWAGWDRGTSIGRINADASRLAFAIGQSVERTMMEADQLTSLIGGAVIELGPELPLAEWTRIGYLATEPFLQTAVLDETGRIRASTNPAFEPLDLSDRAHFRVHIGNPRPTLYVSKPLVGRTSGRWVVQLSKGIVAPNGRFRGVVVVSLDPLSLTNVYKSPLCGPSGTTFVFGPQKGVNEVAAVNVMLARFAQRCTAAMDRDFSKEEGSGAAGGIGYALRLLGAEMVSGATFVLKAAGLHAEVQTFDWVITGEGRSDAKLEAVRRVMTGQIWRW